MLKSELEILEAVDTDFHRLYTLGRTSQVTASCFASWLVSEKKSLLENGKAALDADASNRVRQIDAELGFIVDHYDFVDGYFGRY